MARAAPVEELVVNTIKPPVYRVQVLDRAFAILDSLAERKAGMPLAEISRQLRLNKSTAFRLLCVLEQHHYVEKSGSGGKYYLGSKLIELGLGAVSKLDLMN